jgi:uncharacterized protein (TIGR02145 family)
MKKSSLYLVAILCTLVISGVLFSAESVYAQKKAAATKGTVTDKRDKHVYGWAKIGTYSWMVTNLKFATPAGSWICSNDSTQAETYGRLYDWTAAQKACPSGFHLPTEAEWNDLIAALDGPEQAAGKLAAYDTIGRTPDFIGKHMGFVSIFGGVRHKDGNFSGIGLWGGFWSATPVDNDNAINFLVAHGSNGLEKSSNSKAAGFLVRCVRKK